jgi:hypothetical protein
VGCYICGWLTVPAALRKTPPAFDTRHVARHNFLGNKPTVGSMRRKTSYILSRLKLIPGRDDFSVSSRT